MAGQVNSNYSANFQKFVDFASKAYATKGEDTVVRFSGMPRGDYKGTFASFMRTADMKAANEQVRDLFRQTIADMFGGERNIPDIVRDNMKLEDFGKGKPLTARRIQLVKTAIDTLRGGLFMPGSAAANKATAMGYLPSELPKLARVANIYQQATGCSEEDANAAALDPNSNARKLFDCGGRFTLNVDNFKKGLALMDKFAGWFANMHDDVEAGKLDTPTKLNVKTGLCTRKADVATLKFLLEEIAVNDKLPLDAENPEDIFGMAKNPAMRFVGREHTMSFANSLAQIPPEKRSVIYAVFDAFDKLPVNAEQRAKREEVDQSALLAARVLKNFDAVAALQSAGKLSRTSLVPLLYPDFNLPPTASNKQIAATYDAKIMENADIAMQVHQFAVNAGVSVEEAVDAVVNGKHIDNLPGISDFNGHLDELDGTPAGGRTTMIGDIHRPTKPQFIESKTDAISEENAKFVFNFPGGEKLVAKPGASEWQDVRDSSNAIADKLDELCRGKVHPKQLSNVYFALSQSGIGGNMKGGLQKYGLNSNEHAAVTFTLSRNDETGAVTIKYSEPEGLPVKFNWTTTIDVDGNSTTTPMRVDHGQYEAKAMERAEQISAKMPGKDKAAGEALIKELLAHCGDDFDLKDIVSKNVYQMCVNGRGALRQADEIKAKIDAIRANLAEIRGAANGNAIIEKAGVNFMIGMPGKTVPAGLIGRLVKAAGGMDVGSFAKLTAASTPSQILKAVIDMRQEVEKTMAAEHVEDSLDGGDEMTAVRDLLASFAMAKLPSAQLRGANAALHSDNCAKALTLLDDIQGGKLSAGKLTAAQKGALESQSYEIGIAVGQYNLAVETALGQEERGVRSFSGEFDKKAAGSAEVFKDVLKCADAEVAAKAETQRQTQNIVNSLNTAKTHAVNAYSKAGAGGESKVDTLIYAALKRCAANEDAVNVVANNMDTLLVSSTAKLRSLEDVRKRAEDIAANFAELKELSKDNPAIYEAGKRMMAVMGSKALPQGMIAKLVVAASNAKINAMRKLSVRSSALDIHRAVTEFRDNLVQAMNATGAESAVAGPAEKQACRNFVAAVMMSRCGANALRAMQGAFAGELPAKMLALYNDVLDGHQNEGLEHEVAIQFENQGGSHMTHIIALKDAINLAVDGEPGNGIDPYKGSFNADEFGGGNILDDLVGLASR